MSSVSSAAACGGVVGYGICIMKTEGGSTEERDLFFLFVDLKAANDTY
jgi:hypothetical protein